MCLRGEATMRGNMLEIEVVVKFSKDKELDQLATELVNGLPFKAQLVEQYLRSTNKSMQVASIRLSAADRIGLAASDIVAQVGNQLTDVEVLDINLGDNSVAA